MVLVIGEDKKCSTRESGGCPGVVLGKLSSIGHLFPGGDDQEVYVGSLLEARKKNSQNWKKLIRENRKYS